MRLLAAMAFCVAAAPCWGQEIVSAIYNEPTKRYAHAVLGDDEEWGNMQVVVRRQRGKEGSLFQGRFDLTYDMRLPQEMVFEDIAPRLVDVDGDGAPEIIVVESHQDYGARLAIYGLNDEGVPALRTWTRFIGTPNRWLAPIGAADFDGDGIVDIAFVDRPHLVQRLVLLSYRAGFVEDLLIGLDGISNHRIGEDFISGGVRNCGETPEMVVLTSDWDRVVTIQWDGASFNWRQIAYNTGDNLQKVMDCVIR